MPTAAADAVTVAYTGVVFPFQPFAHPLVQSRDAHIVVYTPQKTASYENLVEPAATTAMCGMQPSARPVAPSVTLDLQIRLSGRTSAGWLPSAARSALPKKPDADNVLNGI